MRWMYPFERYLKKLKDYVRNSAKPEGSIAEGYVVEEALTFCSRYFDDVETRFNRPDRNEDEIIPETLLSVFKSKCRPIGKKTPVSLPSDARCQAEFYILNNCPEIEPYLDEHRQELQLRGETNINELHRNEFAPWFHTKIYAMHRSNPHVVSEPLLSLAQRSNFLAYSYSACVVNGVRFLTQDRDIRRRTQNSGVSVPGIGDQIFYGQLQEILEFSYVKDCSVVLFRCKWFKSEGTGKNIDNNITSIDISREAFKDDQFILASQARQVFYTEDPSRGANWRVVQEVNHRSAWDIPAASLTEIDLLHEDNSSHFSLVVDLGNLENINMQRDVVTTDESDRLVASTSSSTVSGFDVDFINDEFEDVDDEDDTIEEYVDEEQDIDSESDGDDDGNYYDSESD